MKTDFKNTHVSTFLTRKFSFHQTGSENRGSWSPDPECSWTSAGTFTDIHENIWKSEGQKEKDLSQIRALLAH